MTSYHPIKRDACSWREFLAHVSVVSCSGFTQGRSTLASCLTVRCSFYPSLFTAVYCIYLRSVNLKNSISFERFDFLNLSKLSYCFENRVTNHGIALLAERQPRVSPAISTALLHRLAVVNRHMIVWIGWVPSIP